MRIIYRDDKIAAARRWVPILVGIMAGTFSAYLATKVSTTWSISTDCIWSLIGLASFFIVWGITHVAVRRQSVGMENRNQSLRKLFRLPLICSAALLSSHTAPTTSPMRSGHWQRSSRRWMAMRSAVPSPSPIG